ncbi:hypothetical protein [Streptomyces sp. NPDC020996]|uniref:hypothetical protein n=1 Tax=Streptomyces sp. NPDC020996 TaxID=3154791 RepID=UPI0033FAF1E7
MRIGLSGPDPAAILRSICGRLTPETAPSRMYQNDQPVAVDPDWPGQMLGCEDDSFAEWPGDDDIFLDLNWDRRLVRLNWPHPADTEVILAALTSGATPFELASFEGIHREWARGEDPYRPRGFDGLHYGNGWLCGFRGAGHDRLVSRRWLDFGPWRVLRGPGDVTLVQFHDAKADPATALEQARAGHPLLEGITPVSGFMSDRHVITHDLQGVYDPEDRCLRIIVHGRDVSPGEMLDACVARRTQALGPDSPLERVAYVFMDAEAARAHLHALWLRELECWTIELGAEIRLDTDHHPVPVKPEWVKEVESASDGAGVPASASSDGAGA